MIYKFRAWLKQEKKMVEPYAINFEGKVIFYKEPYVDDENMETIKTASFDEIELMLGLKIYDETIFIGDIVRVYGGEYMFGYYEVDKIMHINNLEDLVSLFNMDFGIDILGNIYEDKELLENE